MFKESGARAGVNENKKTGLWALHCSTEQFWAWNSWMNWALGYSGHPHGKWLTVWGQWPPTTQAGACKVAQAISDMRDELKINRAITRAPEPWDGTVPGVPEEFRMVRVD